MEVRDSVPAERKLTDEQVRRIRRRVRRGEGVIDLADEFGVNRKTIWRRRAALERAETERAERIAAKLLKLERDAGLPASAQRNAGSGSPPERGLPRKARVHDPYGEWLDTRKNLSGRALAEARGFVRVRNPESTACVWRERSEIDALFEAGWQLA